MDPPCLVSTPQAGSGGVMVQLIFPWHILGPWYQLIIATSVPLLSVSLPLWQCNHHVIATSRTYRTTKIKTYTVYKLMMVLTYKLHAHSSTLSHPSWFVLRG